jgi:hypothetical protein
MKSSIWDYIFILLLAAFLLILSATGNMGILIKLPFITIYAAYVIGRYVGFLSNKKAMEKNN